MKYARIIDILPDVISATEKGTLTWHPRADGENRDFIASIGDYRIEIEYERGEDRRVKLYLWDNEANIIDSYRVSVEDEGYDQVLSYFSTIQRSAINVPSILTSIVAQLRDSE